MAVLINFKICDNAEDCYGIVNCPTKALTWDDKNNTIVIDNSKCIGCGKCVQACMIHAIYLAKNDQEYAKIKKEIEDDPRKVSDLFIDRYGAQPINEAFVTLEEDFDKEITSYVRSAVVELFDNDSIECMLKSIPVKDLFKGTDIRYRKTEIKSKTLLNKYNVNKLPALLFFNDGKFLGKIEGYYEKSEMKTLKEKINKIIKND